MGSGTHPNTGAGRDGKTGTGNGTFDTLYISDIGYGMCGGPISMGRFGLGNTCLQIDQMKFNLWKTLPKQTKIKKPMKILQMTLSRIMMIIQMILNNLLKTILDRTRAPLSKL